jgi:predicted nuclease with TOPRIM domain
MTNKPQSEMTLDDVRELVKEVRAEGLQIQSHYKRLEKEYSDWEDRVRDLENIIAQAEEDTGLSKEEIITTPSPLEDIFDDLGID